MQGYYCIRYKTKLLGFWISRDNLAMYFDTRIWALSLYWEFGSQKWSNLHYATLEYKLQPSRLIIYMEDLSTLFWRKITLEITWLWILIQGKMGLKIYCVFWEKSAYKLHWYKWNSQTILWDAVSGRLKLCFEENQIHYKL